MFSDGEARKKIEALEHEVASLRKQIGTIQTPVSSVAPSAHFFTILDRINEIAFRVEMLYEYLGIERKLNESGRPSLVKKEEK